ncbi:TIGR03773 family transporter-associated surface protein [Microbacterium sp. SORGH_AS_0888]|uniref:TIGR03773 family transporter-associated surface protein n=1 Tax=Microbacterium sp. SORGH_AS_0888 TaxID=3041791 RepID=UPI0027D801E5|nr:TIGR03773 family transporter-associated surface protein [Microbacterium sp. SORGH_AS_0888]
MWRAALAALGTAAIVVSTVAPAAAAQTGPTSEARHVALADATLPLVVASAGGAAIVAAEGDQPVPLEGTVFDTVAGQQTLTRGAVVAQGLPEGSSVESAELRYVVATAPDGAAVEVLTRWGDERTAWAPETPVTVTSASAAELDIRFSVAGTYAIDLTATVTVSSAAGEQSAETRGRATFEVVPAAEEHAAQTETDAQAQTEQGEQTDQTAQETGQTGVVREGEVSLVSRLVDGDLVQTVEDASGAVLDPARTVFAVPDAEAWPGGADGQDAAFWNEIAPEHGQIWRTSTPQVPGNPLRVAFDSSNISPADVHVWYADVAPKLRTWLGGVTGPAAAGLLGNGLYDMGTTARSGVRGPLTAVSIEPVDAEPSPIAVAFGGAGRYCVTLSAHAQLADGTFVNDDVALTFAVGGVDPATVEPCAQPAAIAPQGPQPIAAQATGVTVIDSGTALLASTLHDGALSLDVVTSDRGRTTSYDPSQVVFSLPSRDTEWAASGAHASQKEMWARYLGQDERAYRSSGRFVVPGAPESANPLTLDLEARFIDEQQLAADQGVEYSAVAMTSTSPTGRFFAYAQGDGSYILSPEDIGFWSSRAGDALSPRGAEFSSSTGSPFYERDREYTGGAALGTAFTDAGVYCITLRSQTILAAGTETADTATFTFAIGVDPAAVVPCSQETGQPAPGTGVVREGEVSLVSRLVDGDLVQTVEDASGAVLDPARTVFAVPDAEAWPGGADAQDAAFWNEIAPEREPVWRTSTPAAPTGSLSFRLDTSAISPSDLYAPSWAFEASPVWTGLGDVSGPGAAGLLEHGTSNAGTTFHVGSQAYPMLSRPTGETEKLPFAVAFSAAGRTCVTLASYTQLADGTALNHDVTLTFAVGGVDPSTVEPCAQPAAIAPHGPLPTPSAATGMTVVDSGTVLLDSRLTDGVFSLDPVVSDRGRLTSYDPSRIVFSLPHRDSRWPAAGLATSQKELWARYLPEDDRAYRTSGDFRLAGTDGRRQDEKANDLTFDLEARSLRPDQITDYGGVDVVLEKTTTTGSGRFFAYRAINGYVTGVDGIGFWDSRDGAAQTPQYAAAGDPSWSDPFYTRTKEIQGGEALGTAFTQDGVYCVTLRSSVTLADGTAASDATTFTFAVGVDASAVAPCSQETGEPGTGGGDTPGGGQPGQLDPSVAWIDKGHLDLAVREDGHGGIEFATGDASTSTGVHALHDAVWVGKGTYVRYTVRQPDAADDRTFIGPPGTTYYGFSAGSEYSAYTLWPGLSMLYLPYGLTERHATWSMQKVSGPGEAYAWSGDSFLLDSRQETPRPFSLGRTHRHLNWAFTEAGVYCIAVRASLRPALDESHDRTAASLLTVVVGDVDLATVQPCERSSAVPAAPAPSDVTLSAGPGVVDTQSINPSLELRRVNGVADVVASVGQRGGGTPTFFDPEKVVYAASAAAGEYRYGDRWRTLEWDTGGSDVTLTLGTVSGPGSYQRRGNSTDSQAVQLDSRQAPVRITERLWPGSNFPANHVFSASGVYCVPFTWTGTLRDGTAFRVTKTLTVAAGVDAHGVTPCASGGSGTEPGNPDPGTPSTDWDVPNHSLTASGATIVTAGHVDVASRIVDGSLTTVIADASDASQPETLRDPRRTVLQVRPEAQTTVPDDAAYSFLGSAGATTWLLPETEVEGILWPGWSTEGIPASATTTGVTWTLDRAQGPGEFALYQTPFTGPKVYFDTRDGITAADTFDIPKTIHAHGTWAFSAEGAYCLAFTRQTTLASGERVSDSFTLAFAVGAVAVAAIDPTRCFQTPDGAPTETDAAPIPLDTLTDAARGGVAVLGAAGGLTAGQLVTVQVDAARAGQWVSVWADASHWLGWAQLGSSGATQVRLPADMSPGSHRIVVKARTGELLGWDGATVLASGTAPGTPGDGGAPETGVWDVPNGTVNRAGAVVLNDGHVDIASLVEGGRLVTRIKDSASVTEPVYRDVSRTVLQVRPDARATVPAGDAWAFLGAAGSAFYQVSQTQQQGLVWPGWSTEGIPLSATTGGVTWSLVDSSGPGEFALYETGAFGQPRVLFSTRDGITDADRVTIPKNTHAHGSWAFGAAGNYCLSMQRTAQLADGRTSSDTFVLAVAVGDADVLSIDPARCREAVDTGTVTVPAPPREDAAATAPAAQQIAANACVAGATILSAGHVDYASRIVDGSLHSLVGDDSSGSKVYREPSGVVLWLKPSARVTLPAGFGEVGPAGSAIWQVPQTQDPDLVWLGWSTESLNAGNVRGPVRWTIDAIEGPGRVTAYLSGSFGGVQQVIFADGGSYDIPLGVHAHANWAFSAQGVYRITSTQTVTLADGRVSSDRETMTIAVGDVDPRTAVAGGSGCGAVAAALLEGDAAGPAPAQAADEAAKAARDILPGNGSDVADRGMDPFSAFAAGNPVPLLLCILGVLLLLGAAGAAVLWARGRRRGPLPH